MTQPGLATSWPLPRDCSQESVPSGAFFSLRCLIYKVHAASGGTLLLYITSSRLSRTFFRSFLTSDPFCISSNFLSLPHSGSFVKNFFQEVLNFRFPVICGNLFRLPHLVAAVKWFFLPTLWRSHHRADSFVRIPDHPPFVNGFLQSFSLFLMSTIGTPYFGTTFVHLCK